MNIARTCCVAVLVVPATAADDDDEDDDEAVALLLDPLMPRRPALLLPRTAPVAVDVADDDATIESVLGDWPRGLPLVDSTGMLLLLLLL